MTQKTVGLFGHDHKFQKMSQDGFSVPTKQQLIEIRKFVRSVKSGDTVGVESYRARMNEGTIIEYEKTLTEEFLENPNIKTIWQIQRAMANNGRPISQDDLLAAIALRKGARIIPIDSGTGVRTVERLEIVAEQLRKFSATPKRERGSFIRMANLIGQFPKLQEKLRSLIEQYGNLEDNSIEGKKAVKKFEQELYQVLEQEIIPVLDK
ncbi:MAG: hypothetical protein Q7S92_05425, partial [Candidatus Diapherotrites archaeon]|nr:hypothetical protein [Candidatus Diapherotrites archaeon]